MATKPELPVNDPMLDPKTGEIPGHRARAYVQVGHREDLPHRAHPPHAAGLVLRLYGGGRASAIMLLIAVTWLFLKGVGIWASRHPGRLGIRHHQLRLVDRYRPRRHADLRHSAAVQAEWRNSINRFAEAMTIFAVVCAGMFPVIHVGRPWLGYWLFPYPNTMNVWPQFRSPLLWDVFAVSTYATISVVFWYIGMIPDLGTLRDRAKIEVRRSISMA